MAGRCLFACFSAPLSTQVTHQTGLFGVIAYVAVLGPALCSYRYEYYICKSLSDYLRIISRDDTGTIVAGLLPGRPKNLGLIPGMGKDFYLLNSIHTRC